MDPLQNSIALLEYYNRVTKRITSQVLRKSFTISIDRFQEGLEIRVKTKTSLDLFYSKTASGTHHIFR